MTICDVTKKDSRDSWGTNVSFAWVTMGRKFLNDHILAKEEGIESSDTVIGQ